jgi:hypothetical protein
MIGLWLPLVVVLLVLEGRGVEGACSRPTVFRLTEPRGVITTPGFPGKFKTPLCRHWIIESGSKNNDKTILVYLTQFYLRENFTFMSYERYNFPYDYYGAREDNAVQKKSSDIISYFTTDFSQTPPIGKPINTGAIEIVKLLKVPTPFFGIQVDLTSPYAKHLRAMNFLNVYGFNITYEIVDNALMKKHEEIEFICSARNCSYSGNCYASKDYR